LQNRDSNQKLLGRKERPGLVLPAFYRLIAFSLAGQEDKWMIYLPNFHFHHHHHSYPSSNYLSAIIIIGEKEILEDY
jgi:hypothetical protein